MEKKNIRAGFTALWKPWNEEIVVSILNCYLQLSILLFRNLGFDNYLVFIIIIIIDISFVFR